MNQTCGLAFLQASGQQSRQVTVRIDKNDHPGRRLGMISMSMLGLLWTVDVGADLVDSLQSQRSIFT
jgi:hypothetical protein